MKRRTVPEPSRYPTSPSWVRSAHIGTYVGNRVKRFSGYVGNRESRVGLLVAVDEHLE